MIKLNAIRNKIAVGTWEFATEAEFIDFTIAHAKANNGGDEYEELTSFGFTEVIDKQTFDEDGEVVEFESHWEATTATCMKYWHKNIRNCPRNGEYYKVTE